MASKAQETAQANMVAELKSLQENFYEDWVSGSLPHIWNDVPVLHPLKPEKIKVTLSLDEDMIKWFRKLGRGYQARINAILRIYWQALLGGQIKAHWDAEAMAPREHTLLEDMLSKKLRDVRGGKLIGISEEEQARMEQELTDGLQMLRGLHKSGPLAEQG